MVVYDKEFVLEHFKDFSSLHMDISQYLTGKERLVIGSIDVCMTTKCNLKCRGCGSLMPLYDKPAHVDIDVILRSLDRFFSVVDRVFRVNVIGGEPFLYPDMNRVISYLNGRDEVVRTVVPTNGLVVPKKEDLYETLRNPKNHVRISHYNHYEDGSKLLCAKLEKENVDYSVKEFGEETYQWYDFGEYELRGRTSEDLKQQYLNCAVEWMSLFWGKLYPCPRAAHSIDLGLQPAKGNYVDVLDETLSLDEFRFELQNFVYERDYYPACNRCDRGTNRCPVIPVAEQG